jgi:protein TonB
MFADSLLENRWTNHGGRGWTTLASFALQTLAIAILLMLPLIYTEAIPRLHLVSMSAALPPPGPPPMGSHYPNTGIRQSNMFDGLVVSPPNIPIAVKPVIDDSPPEEGVACSICVPGGMGPASNTNAIPGGLGITTTVMPPPPRPAPPPRISHMMEGNLIYKVQPVYPPLARQARIQGSVFLRAIISRTGTIENLSVISGHPMLVGAAIEAVHQWRYRPYILNDERVEVETQVTVNFSLSGG